MNSLFKNHVHAEQGHSLMQSTCVAISNWHVHFLSLFFMCFSALLHVRLVRQPQVKLKLFKDMVLGLSYSLDKIKHANVVTKSP